MKNRERRSVYKGQQADGGAGVVAGSHAEAFDRMGDQLFDGFLIYIQALGDFLRGQDFLPAQLKDQFHFWRS